MSKPTRLSSNEGQDYSMQAALLLLKELELSEIELIRRDIDKKIHGLQ